MRTCPHCGAALTRRGVGRPPRHSTLDLADCLGSHELTSGELQHRAAETLDISRATFYRLLDRGRREWLLAPGTELPPKHSPVGRIGRSMNGCGQRRNFSRSKGLWA